MSFRLLRRTRDSPSASLRIQHWDINRLPLSYLLNYSTVVEGGKSLEYIAYIKIRLFSLLK